MLNIMKCHFQKEYPHVFWDVFWHGKWGRACVYPIANGGTYCIETSLLFTSDRAGGLCIVSLYSALSHQASLPHQLVGPDSPHQLVRPVHHTGGATRDTFRTKQFRRFGVRDSSAAEPRNVLKRTEAVSTLVVRTRPVRASCCPDLTCGAKCFPRTLTRYVRIFHSQFQENIHNWRLLYN